MTTMTTPSETSVCALLVENLDGGFTVLVEQYQGRIYSGALRLTRSPEDARDVAQETFLRAYRALESYDTERIDALRLRPWLWTIALNLCRSKAERTKWTSPLPPDDTLGGDEHEHFDDDAWNARLALLSAPQRTAVILRHIADLSIAEIATTTRRPEGTVKTDISRGLTRLRTTIENEDTR
jgi:RNA polymerase sigma-70 factor (ECF subfamily)